MLLRVALASCVAAVLLATASPALAGTREKILQECQDGRLSGHYTVKQIRDARDHIPTDIDQYSDCRDVLSRALADAAGGGGAGGGGGASGGGGVSGGGGSSNIGGGSGPLLTPTSPADQAAIAKAQSHGSAPVNVGGTKITPGAAGFAAGAPRTGLPAGVIVVLALLGVAAAAGGAPVLRGRIGALSPSALATFGKRVLARGR